MELPRLTTTGLLIIPDPHVAATPPGHRLEGYTDQVLDKISFALKLAAENDLLPVFLGDLFHWPRENPNTLLVRLIEMFRPYKPYTLVGNHDKYQARFTADTSLAVLNAAGVVELLDKPGPFLRIATPTGQAVLGASPDATPIPLSFDRAPGSQTVWLTHHNISFPDFKDRFQHIREISGVDWVINGHIHRPQPSVTVKGTTWANPGNITRLSFTRRSMERVPAVSVWRPGCAELEKWPLPHLPFNQVFPDTDFPPEEQNIPQTESRFLQGLERLAMRRTAEGAGLKEFLQANLNPENPETLLIWELYREVTHAQHLE
ncbi:MAG: metallophosphoesterase [Desulfovibrio sp.]|nr:metallophosphoesterase [Desulfovibrio sp.]